MAGCLPLEQLVREPDGKFEEKYAKKGKINRISIRKMSNDDWETCEKPIEEEIHFTELNPSADTRKVRKVSEKKEMIMNSCSKCYRILKNKQNLVKHERECLKIKEGESFFKNAPKKEKYDSCDKVLPLSQPLKDGSFSFASNKDYEEKKQERNNNVEITHQVKAPEKRNSTAEPQIIAESEVNGLMEKSVEIHQLSLDGVEIRISPLLEEKKSSEIDFEKEGDQEIINGGEKIHNKTVLDQGREICQLKCSVCAKVFKTNRGLNAHMTRKCCKSLLVNGLTENLDKVKTVNDDASSIRQNNVWGDHSYDDLLQICNSVYDEVVYWKKHLFKLPSGKTGKRYIKEMTRLIDLWNDNSLYISNFSLKLLMVMPSLLLLKPCRKSTSKQHTEYLNSRMELWENGNFDVLVREGRAIQHKENRRKRKKIT